MSSTYVPGVYELSGKHYQKMCELAIRQAPKTEVRQAMLEYAKDLMFYDEAFKIMHPEYELPDLDVDFGINDL